MKILIVSPLLNRTGGVSNFYRMLSPHFSKNEISFFHICGNDFFLSKLYHRLFDPIRFFYFLCMHPEFQTILLNPSLGINSFLRDGVLCYIANRIMHRKVAVFWHGWSCPFEEKINRSKILQFFFRRSYANSFVMFTLCNAFLLALKKWKYAGNIILMTTCVEDELFYALNHPNQENNQKSDVYRYLFLSRLEPQKGVETVLNAYEKLRKKYGSKIEFVIAGNGSLLKTLSDQVTARKIDGVSLPGYVKGEEKIKLLREANCFCFPSSYGEGMPCALLEAIGAGLTILTSPAGGIADFFIAPQMGTITADLSEDNFANLMEESFLSSSGTLSKNSFNQQYAQEKLLASKVSAKLLQHLKMSF